MRPKTLATLFLATLCLAPSLARAQKPVYSVPVSITFDDISIPHDPNYSGVQSDGGSYVDGKDGIDARINLNSGDLLLGLNSNQNKTRYLWMNLWSLVSPVPANDCPVYQTAKPPPMGWFRCRPFLNINGIWYVQPGESKWLGAAIDFTGYGQVRLQSKWGAQSNYCSGPVLVTRVDQNTWTISSPSIPVTLHEGIAAVVQDLPRNGPDSRPVAYVQLPFSITVTSQQ